MENQKPQNKKTCYYEILGVDKKATDAEIKQAYKKMALKYHPDKNTEEDAKQTFQSIIEAYETLNDPNERSWYDSHRDQILKGTYGEPMSKEEQEQNTYGFNIWPYFSSSCYNSFEESEQKNFYEVYSDVFDKIKNEEWNAYEYSEEIENEKYIRPEPFGNSKSNDKEVQTFYRWWSNFFSYKSFSWCDVYNLNEAPNRFERRQMEKINKKERFQEKKKYIKTIKELVEFVRRRDPRWKKIEDQRQLEEDKKKEEQRLKQEEEKRKKQEKLKQMEEQLTKKQKQLAKMQKEQQVSRAAQLDEEYRIYKEQQLKFQQEQEQLQQIENLQKEEEEEEEQIEEANNFMCELCNKGFRTEELLEKHNNSNTHKNKKKKLQRKINQQNNEEIQAHQTNDNNDEQETQSTNQQDKFAKGKKSKKQKNKQEEQEQIQKQEQPQSFVQNYWNDEPEQTTEQTNEEFEKEEWKERVIEEKEEEDDWNSLKGLTKKQQSRLNHMQLMKQKDQEKKQKELEKQQKKKELELQKRIEQENQNKMFENNISQEGDQDNKFSDQNEFQENQQDQSNNVHEQLKQQQEDDWCNIKVPTKKVDKKKKK